MTRGWGLGDPLGTTQFWEFLERTSTNPDRRFSSSTSQHFKMSPPFASSEGVSASGDRLQSDGVQDTHLLPHSLSTRIRERMCDFALTHSHSPFAYFAYIPSYSLLIILSEVL